MKINKTTRVTNDSNHKWWHFIWYTWIRVTHNKSWSNKEVEEFREFCERDGCGWERLTITTREKEL